MRIIAGSRRSLPLKSVPGMGTRPTTDKTKETLFNCMQAEIPGAYFLDLFAGCGQIGLEAMSRGAQYCVFVEKEKKAIACIEDNISFTKFNQETKLIPKEVLYALTELEGRYQFDIIFMDPPYNHELEKEVLIRLQNSPLLKEDGMIVVEASLQTDFSYLDDLGYSIIKQNKYKNNTHIFIERKRVH